ncbi:uncharacterized protein SPSK_04591 [Sporothrix schenckii 1099-18]|uniref:Uncharacterized protein n=1 Tax=Sporothrix schenckii 1099-18 TaxID=1397361 RepID=A0A0F2M1J1_SPOSC|nr:uncharacterized protein SPSK_04591 [Sporothrix schenckii 1099-18]KJR83582.1 hypothetical protein SPSK_04591 [Sporothrix schenckii 1099-18]
MPSQGSGAVHAAKSSMEKRTSTPFSKRDSGSALSSQYCRAAVEADVSPSWSCSAAAPSSATGSSLAASLAVATALPLPLAVALPLIFFAGGACAGAGVDAAFRFVDGPGVTSASAAVFPVGALFAGGVGFVGFVSDSSIGAALREDRLAGVLGSALAVAAVLFRLGGMVGVRGGIECGGFFHSCLDR